MHGGEQAVLKVTWNRFCFLPQKGGSGFSPHVRNRSSHSPSLQSFPCDSHTQPNAELGAVGICVWMTFRCDHRALLVRSRKTLSSGAEACKVVPARLATNVFGAECEPQPCHQRRVIVGFAPVGQVLPRAPGATGEAPRSVFPHACFPTRLASFATKRSPSKEATEKFGHAAPVCDPKIPRAAIWTGELHGLPEYLFSHANEHASAATAIAPRA
jgi:hypothetical protein